MSDLFAPPPPDSATSAPPDHRDIPLAERLRPQSLDEIIGQDHLLGEKGALAQMLESRHLPSLILWGPPGCGKTTLARLLSGRNDLHFEQISAIYSGVAELRKIFEAAKIRRNNTGRASLLFVDEIHRFNKSQQDAFLPHIESGLIILIGATTENPSFELNAALLSRCHVLVLNRLSPEALAALLERVEKHLGHPLPLDEAARTQLISMADGDGRALLNLCEALAALPPEQAPLGREELGQLLQRRAPLYDKSDEAHYNLISALHKAVRGSDTDAALYWLARMFAGGEDPHYVARRMVRMAVEDIGLADPQALPQALSAWQAYERLGSPEGELALAQCCLYLATAPKSNAAYMATKAAMKTAKETGSLMPPAHSLNAPTQMMKELGYGQNYAYDHDTAEGFSGASYFPDDMARIAFYNPVERGFEREIKKRLIYWQGLRESKNRERGAQE